MIIFFSDSRNVIIQFLTVGWRILSAVRFRPPSHIDEINLHNLSPVDIFMIQVMYNANKNR